jgi:hypothetical protein
MMGNLCWIKNKKSDHRDMKERESSTKAFRPTIFILILTIAKYLVWNV